MRKKRKMKYEREREGKQRDAKKEEKRGRRGKEMKKKKKEGQFVNFWYRSTPQS